MTIRVYPIIIFTSIVVKAFDAISEFVSFRFSPFNPGSPAPPENLSEMVPGSQQVPDQDFFGLNWDTFTDFVYYWYASPMAPTLAWRQASQHNMGVNALLAADLSGFESESLMLCLIRLFWSFFGFLLCNLLTRTPRKLSFLLKSSHFSQKNDYWSLEVFSECLVARCLSPFFLFW